MWLRDPDAAMQMIQLQPGWWHDQFTCGSATAGANLKPAPPAAQAPAPSIFRPPWSIARHRRPYRSMPHQHPLPGPCSRSCDETGFGARQSGGSSVKVSG